MEALVVNYLMYCLVPLWLLAGFADWYCHYRDRIEFSSGLLESIIHVLMMIEMGVALLAALFFEINALVILIGAIAFICHELTALWDVSFAMRHRAIAPIEQHIHSFLEIIPLMALSLMILLHWPQFLVLLGISSERADFSLHWRAQPLAHGYVAGLLLAVALLLIIPYAQELLRALAARRPSDPRRAGKSVSRRG